MRQTTTILFSALAALVSIEARAQVPGAIQQVESTQQRRDLEQSALSGEDGAMVPDLFPGERSDIGPQSVLRIKPRRTYFEGFADVQYFYTDNMFLSDKDEQGADVLVSTVQAAFAPTAYDLADGKFSPRVGYQAEWFTYGLASSKQITAFDFSSGTFKQVNLSEFDFNSQTVFGDARWSRGNWIVGAGFDWRRLLDSDDYEQFYREYVPRWEVRRIFPLCERSALSVGYEGDYRFTDTDLPPPGLGSDFNDRTDQNLVLNYSYVICQHAIAQPYYRLQYTHFTEDQKRDDYLNSFGLALYCPLTAQITLRAFFSYDIMRTTSDFVPDYNKLDAGGGLNLTIRF